MARKIAVKKYTGIYYTKSTRRKWRERPDRCYWIAFRDPVTRKLRWERCGWASERWTPEKAQNKRYEILNEVRTGQYVPKEKRKLKAITFSELMEKHYLPWSKDNKKSFRDDHTRYEKWLKPSIRKLTLGEITPFHLEKIKIAMKRAGRAEATIKHVLALVREGYNRAVDWGLYEGETPVSRVKIPSTRNTNEFDFCPLRKPRPFWMNFPRFRGRPMTRP